jgi:hypothetical protein
VKKPFNGAKLPENDQNPGKVENQPGSGFVTYWNYYNKYVAKRYIWYRYCCIYGVNK